MAKTQLNYGVPGPKNITRVELDNGIVVLAYENYNAQSVVISGSIANGSLYEPLSKIGLASMTASALMMGTKNRNFDAIHSALEDTGADLNVSARVHKSGFGGKALAEDLPLLVDVLADILRNPVFPEDHIERMRGERLTWLQYSQQDTRYRAGRAFREALYPDEHPYHHSTWGTLQTLSELSPEDMREFHKQQYGPRDMIITIVGAVKANDAVQIVRDHLEDWTNPQQVPQPDLPKLDTLEEIHKTFTQVPGKSQADVVLGTYGPSRFDKDYPAAVLANSVLGEFGMMGRIGQVIREDLGLAYYAYSRLEGGYGPGAWSILAGVAPENIDVTIEKALEEVRAITSEPVSDEDLHDIQSYYTGRLPLRLESNEGIAGNLHGMESFGLGLDYIETYHERIYSLTKDDLLAATRRYMKPDALVISVAGPHKGE